MSCHVFDGIKDVRWKYPRVKRQVSAKFLILPKIISHAVLVIDNGSRELAPYSISELDTCRLTAAVMQAKFINSMFTEIKRGKRQSQSSRFPDSNG